MAVRYEKVEPDPKECQLPPRSSSQLYEGPEPEGAFEMFALRVTACPTRGLAGLAVMETCKGEVDPMRGSRRYGKLGQQDDEYQGY